MTTGGVRVSGGRLRRLLSAAVVECNPPDKPIGAPFAHPRPARRFASASRARRSSRSTWTARRTRRNRPRPSSASAGLGQPKGPRDGADGVQLPDAATTGPGVAVGHGGWPLAPRRERRPPEATVACQARGVATPTSRSVTTPMFDPAIAALRRGRADPRCRCQFADSGVACYRDSPWPVARHRCRPADRILDSRPCPTYARLPDDGPCEGMARRRPDRVLEYDDFRVIFYRDEVRRTGEARPPQRHRDDPQREGYRRAHPRAQVTATTRICARQRERLSPARRQVNRLRPPSRQKGDGVSAQRPRIAFPRSPISLVSGPAVAIGPCCSRRCRRDAPEGSVPGLARELGFFRFVTETLLRALIFHFQGAAPFGRATAPSAYGNVRAPPPHVHADEGSVAGGLRESRRCKARASQRQPLSPLPGQRSSSSSSFTSSA